MLLLLAQAFEAYIPVLARPKMAKSAADSYVLPSVPRTAIANAEPHTHNRTA